MPKKGRQATRTTPGFTGPFKGNAQQGTLFDVRTLPKTGEEIGPRGYSVNRSRQFRDTKVHWKLEASSDPEMVEMHPYGESRDPHSDYGHFGRGASHLLDTLARSTVPPESVKGLRSISVEPQHPGRAGSYLGGHIHLHATDTSMEGLGGSYQHPEPWTHEDAPPGTKRPEQRGPVDPDAELTMLHELGHHVSAVAKTQSSEYRTPIQQGREEGFADAFMMSHYREDPRTARWRGRTDPREHSYMAREQLGKFGAGPGPREYRAALGRSNVKPESPTLNVMSGAGAATERRERPMLDEPLPPEQQVFNQRIEGWSSRGATPEEHREGVYNKAAQLTNMRRGRAEEARGGGKAEVKRRWGVNRNLGSQWRERDEP